MSFSRIPVTVATSKMHPIAAHSTAIVVSLIARPVNCVSTRHYTSQAPRSTCPIHCNSNRLDSLRTATSTRPVNSDSNRLASKRTATSTRPVNCDSNRLASLRTATSTRPVSCDSNRLASKRTATNARPVSCNSNRPLSKRIAASTCPVNSVEIDIANSLAAMSLSTIKKASLMLSTTNLTAVIAKPLSTMSPKLIIKRQRSLPRGALTSTALASALANIAVRRQRVRSRNTSISSSTSEGSQATQFINLEPLSRRHRGYLRGNYRQLVATQQDPYARWMIKNYVVLDKHLEQTASRIPTKSHGRRPYLVQTRSKSIISLPNIGFRFYKPVRVRGSEPYCQARPCWFDYDTDKTVKMDRHGYPHVYNGRSCPCHDLSEVQDAFLIPPESWGQTPAEADVNPHRPTRVRFPQNPCIKIIEFPRYSGEWVDQSTDESKAWNDESDIQPTSEDQELASMTLKNTATNTRATLDNSSKLQCIDTKFGRRYEHRRIDTADAEWAAHKQLLDKLMAELSDDDIF